MQILIQTDKVQMEKPIKRLHEFQEKEPFLKEMVEDYISFIMQIVRKKESVSRKFYLVLKKPEKLEKLFSFFELMGNDMIPCQEEEMISILKRFFKRNSGIRKETKWV